jgi:phosphodiesterase/alkaline phosphatase D-like protein
MSNAISRRAFNAFVLAGSALAILPQHAAVAAAKGRYASRIRYNRRGNVYQFWIRLADRTNSGADVPLTLTLASDPEFQNVLRTKNLLSRQSLSYISRTSIVLGAGAPAAGTKLYARLSAGAEATPVRHLQMKAPDAT